MKRINFSRAKQRALRAKRLHVKIRNLQLAANKPVLVITKTNAHIWAQLICYNKNITLASSSSVQLDLQNGNKDNARLVGVDIAKKALAQGFKQVIFNKNGAKYHGRIKALADAAREAGKKKKKGAVIIWKTMLKKKLL